MNRTFEPTKVHHEGKVREAYRLTCSSDGVVSPPVIRNGSLKSYTPEVIARAFERKGWVVGKRPGSDLCPACVSREDERRRRVRVLKEIVTEVEKKVSNPMPETRVMTRADRRIINSKLDEVYADEAKGYKAPWSDKRVAADLGCPIEWVARIRDEMYGPISDNAEARELLDAVEREGDAVAALSEKLTAINKEVAALRQRVAANAKAAEDIQRAIR